MSEAYIIGTGVTQFGRFPDRTVEALAAEAALAALEDGGIGWGDIQEVYAAHVNQGVAAGQRVMRELGPTGIPVMNIENCAAAGSTALRQAAMTVRAGIADLVMVIGFEKMDHGMLLSVHPDGDPDVTAGLAVLPMRFAMMEMEHQARFGTTKEHFAQISVKNRAHAAHNPKAHYRKPVTLDEVLGSRMVCDPITILQCSPTSDGAAAVVVASERFVRKHGGARAVKVVGSALTSDRNELGFNRFNVDHLRHASGKLYEKTGIGPADLDVVETHDCFAVAEVVAYEAMGLCAEGDAARLIEERQTYVGGAIPVNPSGGLLSKGHPLGASGVAQIAEVVSQIRGESGNRQVEGARIGMTVNMGMWSCCVTMLSS